MGRCKYFDVCNLEHPAKPDGHLCILHSDESSKPHFWDAFKTHLQRSSNFQWIVFPGLVSWPGLTKEKRSTRDLNFSNAKFLGIVNFRDCQFDGHSNFRGAVFRDKVSFRNLHFAREVDFSNATFCSETEFGEVHFKNRVNFFEVTFHGKTRFYSDSEIKSPTFTGEALFDRAKFLDEANFIGCYFNSFAEFELAEFHSNARFTAAKFFKGANFDNVKFVGTAEFAAVEFRDIASFRGGSDNMVFFGPGIFEWARVLDVNQLHFQRVNLSKVRLRNAQIKNIEFTDVRWAVVRNVFGMKKREAVYDEISRSKDADWSDVERLYRQLKQNHEDKRDFERAGQFHVGEKEMRLRNLATSRSLRILLALYKLTSGYGESYLLPFCWLVGLVAFVSTMGIFEGLWEEDWRRAGLYTVRTILHLSGDDLKQHSLLFGLSSTMASALGPLFIAMAIFGMRQRLKR